MVQLSHPYVTTGKTIALAIDLCRQSDVSALYAVYVGHSFPSKEQASFNFVAAITVCTDFGAQENKIWHCFPICCHEVTGPDAMILVFWMLGFKPPFSLFSFIFIKRLFSSSSFSTIKVVSSAYLRLLLYLPEILIPAWDSSSLAFLMMYPACKLNNQSDSIQSWHTPFPILNQSMLHVQF